MSGINENTADSSPRHGPLLPVLVGSWLRGQRSQLIPESNSTALSPPLNTIKARSGIREWLAGSVSFQREQRGCFTLSHNSTFMAGSQKNYLPDHDNCSNCNLKQTEDYLSNSCDVMPKCAVMIISIISGQLLWVLTGLLCSCYLLSLNSSTCNSLLLVNCYWNCAASVIVSDWLKRRRSNFKIQQLNMEDVI